MHDPASKQQLASRLHQALAPDAAALDRIRARVQQDLEKVDRPQVMRPRRRRFRRTGVALAGAAAIASAIALAPFDEHSSSVVPAPATARAALEQAADAAGDAPWHPLADGEYHHTMTTSFNPTIPGRDKDAPSSGAPDSNESFLDREGHGLQISAMGSAGDPKNVPWLGKPDRHGNISGMGYSLELDTSPDVDTATRLRFADAVTFMDWREGTGPPIDRGWFRQANGYVPGFDRGGGASPASGLDLGQRFQLDQWGLPIEDVDRLNDASPASFESVLQPYMDRQPQGEIAVVGPLSKGDYDETDEWFKEQIRVQNGVELLGAAPLAPRVRKQLFLWLSKRPDATIDGSARDERGRTGTRITFERKLNEPVPAFHVTVDELRQDAKDHRQPWDGPIDNPRSVDVPAHSSIGRWYLTILIDPDTGTLLQQEVFSDWKTTVGTPRLMTSTSRGNGNGWNLKIGMEPGWYGMLGGTLYDVNERTTELHPLTAACSRTPRMCR